jgi:hypothetical protein
MPFSSALFSSFSDYSLLSVAGIYNFTLERALVNCIGGEAIKSARFSAQAIKCPELSPLDATVFRWGKSFI